MLKTLTSVVSVLALATRAHTDRTTVSLDLGWRVKPASPPPCAYPENVPGVLQGTGWSAPGKVTTASECEAAACAANAVAWSFCAGPGVDDCGGKYRDPHYNQGPPPRCIIGNTGQIYPYLTNWTSKSRQTSTGPSADTPEAQPTFDDADWTVVDLPHDASVERGYTPDAEGGQGFIPAVQTYYRKHVRLPSAWKGQAITLEVDGALVSSTWWINGVRVVALKSDGYLPLTLRLDQLDGVTLRYGDTPESDNVIVAWTDNSMTTGWWYEGSGLPRHARLVVAPPTVHIKPFGMAAPAAVTGPVTVRAHPSLGVSAAATVHPTVDVSVVASAGAGVGIKVTVDLVDTMAPSSPVVGHVEMDVTLKNDATIKVPPIVIKAAELWSVPRPYLYTMMTTLTAAGASDTVNTTVGIRDLEWNPTDGLHVNTQRVKMRGFCNHESFAGVGNAIPPRIDLLRVQQMRGVGGNAWRTSHNPPEPALLDMADRLGILVLDENRVFATTDNCPGNFSDPNGSCARGDVPVYTGSVPADVGRLALRDRNHPSVAWWSLCNEMGCGPGTLLANDTAQQCKDAIHAVDTSRAITGNWAWQGAEAVAPDTPIAAFLDVMGMSHQQTDKLTAWHAARPNKLVVMTECCSCETQRGEDTDLLPFVNQSRVYFSNENAACVEEQTQRSNSLDYVGGTFVWTLHDYLGEPGAYPHISSSFGSFDLAGFAKAPAWWYRSWWLADIPLDDAGRPPLAAKDTTTFCKLVESWQPLPNASTKRTLNVYTNAPFARITVTPTTPMHGDTAATSTTVTPTVAVPPFGSAVFSNVQYVAGSARADCLDGNGASANVLASDSKSTWGTAHAIKLSVDVPSLATGTGTRLYLDGADVALVRATVVDTNGHVVHTSTDNITFGVTQGPGRVVAVGNGDPADHEPNHVSWKRAYHGLARAIARVTLLAAGSDVDRTLVSTVNSDAGKGPLSSKVAPSSTDHPTVLVVSASAPGLQGDTVTIPLSVDPMDSPLGAAQASVGLADIGASDTF
eukprot:m.75023 g.75023  ORF g.75023 m.75023 type:complete len:1021 (+) comp8957_c0_seq1:151-3213(+)